MMTVLRQFVESGLTAFSHGRDVGMALEYFSGYRYFAALRQAFWREGLLVFSVILTLLNP